MCCLEMCVSGPLHSAQRQDEAGVSRRGGFVHHMTRRDLDIWVPLVEVAS